MYWMKKIVILLWTRLFIWLSRREIKMEVLERTEFPSRTGDSPGLCTLSIDIRVFFGHQYVHRTSVFQSPSPKEAAQYAVCYIEGQRLIEEFRLRKTGATFLLLSDEEESKSYERIQTIIDPNL